ncbi:MAG: hypothetical protein NUV78_02735 [Candidatus Zambryskibacteria bacterium]|nr:hypothetical protein [Candidatus Zambryskibacteria bacterium]
MKKILVPILIVVAAFGAILIVKQSQLASEILWSVSREGSLILPLVLVAAVLDSVHPCSFSILLITIAFLFGLQFSRKRILQIGGTYVVGIFAAYLLIGLGILKALHLFNTPHFMGKLGAGLLIVFGILNLVNRFFPSFPLKLKMPSVSKDKMSKLMERASIPAAFVLGLLVGVCQFPCMGGPYLMVIGLLSDTKTYFAGFGYLLLYNLILIVPLVIVLWLASGKTVIDKMEEWKRTHMGQVRLWAGIVMIVLGLIILYI